MSKFPLVGVGLLVLAMATFTGCSGQRGGTPKDSEKPTKKEGDDGRWDQKPHGGGWPGPHGGTIVEFGKWYGEFTVNHKVQEATVYVLGANEKTAAPIQVEKLLLSFKRPQFQVDLKATPQEGDPAGKSSRFVGKHENFGKEQDLEGTLSGVVDGKPYAGDFRVQSDGW